jgi:hypothetical protein
MSWVPNCQATQAILRRIKPLLLQKVYEEPNGGKNSDDDDMPDLMDTDSSYGL